MTTLTPRRFVSIAATMTITLALAACASTSRPVSNRPISSESELLSIRFENLSRQTVDVYLIGVKREWLLGRVAPGAAAKLRLPDGAFEANSMMMRLAVLAGEPVTFAAARDPHAVLSIVEPASAMLSKSWTFSQGNLISPRY